MPSIEIHISGRSSRYEVVIGRAALGEVGPRLSAEAFSRRSLIVADSAVAKSHAARVDASLRAHGFETRTVTVEASERTKTLDTVHNLYRAMIDARLERRSPVIAVGGGVVGDTAGFAAATFMRGLPFVNAPTTLLSMVDASVGGKTGVNLEAGEALGIGKNLVGAFHQPALVVADVDTLLTLPPRHFRCGLAECVKHALLADADLFRDLEERAQAPRTWSSPELIDLVARNVRIKASIVEADEREIRQRMLLNLGHTFAHAIETNDAVGLWHGEAVSVGLVAAARAGIASGHAEPELVHRIRSVLERLELPVRVSNLPSDETLLDAMRHDKKVDAGHIRIVVPTRVGNAIIIDDAPLEAIRAGWSEVRAS
ncbi:MAG: 3-dehydroquinate synthase [Phycisphaerales bacterium]